MISGRGGVFVYNNDRKQAFIEKEYNQRKKDDIKKQCSWVFNTSEAYENKYDRDVAEFSYEEILEMYKSVKISLGTLFVFHRILKKYSFETLGEASKYLLFTQTELKKHFINEKKVLLSERDVINFTEELLNPMDRFCVYGLFCGIKGKEYCELNFSSMDGANESENSFWLADIDENGEIKLKGRKFYADKLLYGFAKDASEAVYMLQHTKDGVDKKIILEQGTKNIFKTPFSPLEQSVNADNVLRITQRFNRTILNTLNLNGLVTPLDFYWSGIIYSLQKKALSYGKTLKTLKDYADFFADDGCEDIQKQYNIELNSRRLKAKLERYL